MAPKRTKQNTYIHAGLVEKWAKRESSMRYASCISSLSPRRWPMNPVSFGKSERNTQCSKHTKGGVMNRPVSLKIMEPARTTSKLVKHLLCSHGAAQSRSFLVCVRRTGKQLDMVFAEWQKMPTMVPIINFVLQKWPFLLDSLAHVQCWRTMLEAAAVHETLYNNKRMNTASARWWHCSYFTRRAWGVREQVRQRNEWEQDSCSHSE